MAEVWGLFLAWISSNAVQLVVTIVVVVAYIVLERISTPRLEQGADQGRFKAAAATKAVQVARTLIAVFGLLAVALVWGIDFHSLFIFASATITLLGVALFASWSILSNVTAYFVLLMHPSFRRGTFVRIVDADNYAEGYISELTLFNLKLVTEAREVIVYPNNLVLNRPALINPRDRLQGVGKLTRAEPVPDAD